MQVWNGATLQLFICADQIGKCEHETRFVDYVNGQVCLDTTKKRELGSEVGNSFGMTCKLAYFTTAHQLFVVRLDEPTFSWICDGRSLLLSLPQVFNVDLFGKGWNQNSSFAHSNKSKRGLIEQTVQTRSQDASLL